MHYRKFVGAVAASALLFSIPITAHADTYAPNAASQDFNGSDGGWTQTTAYSPTCLPQLACPTVVNTYSGAGGADGNGYVRTQFSSVLETVPGTSSGIWESPSFTYNGEAGKVPGNVSFDMNILKNIGALIDLSQLNNAQFSVDLIDQASGTGVSVVPSSPLTQNSSWIAIPTVPVNPALLALGHSYKIRITTSYSSVATVQGQGEVGFDDVRLTTANGVIGPNGGSGITDIKQLRKLTKTYILPDTAKVSGHLLRVKLRCPAIADPKPCQIQLSGLQKGKFSKAATARKVVKLKAGKTRIVKIRIKPAYVAAYQAATKIWTKAIVRVGKVRVTVRKRMKLK